MALYSKSTGRERLHPEDRPEAPGLGVFALSNGTVDLSKVPAAKTRQRRQQRQDWPALKAERKQASRHPGRSARRNAAKRAAKQAATITP